MGASRVYRVGTPFNGVELADVDYEQTADVMYMTHIDHPVTKMSRYGHTDWRFDNVTFGPTIAAPTGLAVAATIANTDADNGGNAYFPQAATYVVTALNDDTGQESRASNEATATNDLTLKRNYNTLSWSAVTGANRYRIYKAEGTGAPGYLGVTEDLTFVDDNIGPTLDEGPPVADNPFAGAGNRPSTVTLFEQRLVLARTRSRPNGIWTSRSGDYENMDISRPLRDDDAIAIGVVASRVNAINQLVSISSLLACTSDGIFKIDGANEGGYLTATQARARRQIGHGSSRLNPIVVDNAVFFQPATGGGVRMISYSFEQDGFKADDVTVFSPHFFRDFDIVDWAFAREPDSLLWAVRSDGKLLCFTWEQEQQVWGWTLCETDGFVESVCAITEDGEDRLYLTVRRTIGGVERLFVERMASSKWVDPALACFLDCAITYSFPTAKSVVGRLGHLEGRAVTAYANGAYATGLVVTNGQITLPASVGPATVVTVGLPYDVTVQTLPLIVNGSNNAGRKQQTGEAVVSLRQSGMIEVGPDAGKMQLIKPRGNEAWGEATALLDGDYRVTNEAYVTGNVSLIIRQSAPLPFTLVGAALEPIIGG